ncbi:N-acyl-D-amino-acid deacylase family protein [Clostridium cochlearium]|uniref:N-acyl-D-amino-acid deacylase family protein n=1 Tax=Clostridium cochlearium TaxID=1494 RepID=UPI00156F8528|nr:D-aminoacylase [Clostridium cochlearium]MCG4580251.1 D-aminoacylase [Clostridium cochlearium]NSJ91711.1 D-aminoacylase [Coprococcus sp. MSK.21.13]
MTKLLIKNGIIIDGTGKERFKGDIAIENDIIVNIGKIKDECFDKVIDADGKIVAPGFIDTHSHSSMLLFEDPYLSPKIRQGITTELVAQDGMGPAPVNEETLSPWIKAMKGLEGEYQVDWTWKSVADYLATIEKLDLGPNIAYLAPHGNVRMISMGLDNRKPTEEEIKLMQENLAKAIDQGAFGMSTGMIYPPCCYAEIDEFIELGKVLQEKGGVFVTHQRSEADSILDSMEEILTIGKESGCKVHFSHFKVCGKKNWDKFPKVLARLDKAKEDGMTVSFDQYPYVAGSTMMSVILPPWVHDGGTNKLIERLKDQKLREKMKEDIANGIPGWDNFVEFAGLEGIFVTFVGSEKNQDVVGKNLIEVGEIKGKDPLDAIFDVIMEEENIVGLVDFYGTEEHVKLIMSRPEQNVCTDGIMGGKPHPRLYGAFPRVLAKYVREEKAFTLETAIHKMTGKSAQVLGLTDRGILKEGLAADIVIFDSEKIQDTANFTNPIQYPLGIDYVLVNGKVLINEGEPQPQKAGKVLRFQKR